MPPNHNPQPNPNLTSIVGVLTKNPYAHFDLSKATPVLALAFSLMGVMVLGSLAFMRWDKYDRHEEIYLADIKSRLRQRWIYEDLRAGGSGILIETSLSPMERINGVRQPMAFAAANVRNYVHRALLKQTKGEVTDVGKQSNSGEDDSSDRGYQGDAPASTGSQPYHHHQQQQQLQQQRSGSSFGQPTQLLHLDAVAEGGYAKSHERRGSLSVESPSPFYRNTAVDFIPLPAPASSSTSKKSLQFKTYGMSAAEAEAALQDSLPESMDFSDPLHAAVLVSEFTNQVLTLPTHTLSTHNLSYLRS